MRTALAILALFSLVAVCDARPREVRRGGSCANGNCGGGFSYTRQYTEPNAPVAKINCGFMGESLMLDRPATTAIAATNGLIAIAGSYPGARCCEGKQQPYLMQLAQAHADYMCRTKTQGHQNWDTRFAYIQRAGLGTGHEITAESWDWQAWDTPHELGMEMFKCWAQSPGHWETASTPHKYYGAGMARGSNGVWYACIIVSD